ncbi:MAG: type II toxin-antitoxin system HicB family antitoxin [Sheuella sp.]|nr:type II toxin-antitoxin system HicB family antitoxin [Sheuella sp.]
MTNELEYKGYKGSVEFSAADEIFFGKVLFIDSLLMYHGTTVNQIKAAFVETIDAYLEHCLRNNKKPNKTYSGTFNIRIGEELHKKVAEISYRRKISINEVLRLAVNAYVEAEGAPVVVNNHYSKHVSVRYEKFEEELSFNFVQGESQWQKSAPVQ